jgi:signal transduction histidine kinase
VRIDLEQLAATTAGHAWVRVSISDKGEGISRKNLQNISSGYFSTKETGDENRGFGLGLAICRKIVHQHGGNLNIVSEEKKGTTVTVDLPVRFTPPAQPQAFPAEDER